MFGYFLFYKQARNKILILFEWIFKFESEFKHILSINCHFCLPCCIHNIPSMYYNYSLTMSSCIMRMRLVVNYRKACNYSSLVQLQPHSSVSTTIFELPHPSLANKILQCLFVLLQPWLQFPPPNDEFSV